MPPATDLEARFPDMPAVLHVHAISWAKWGLLRQCFPGRRLVRVRNTHALPPCAWLVAWGMSPIPAGLSSAARVLRLEDGFLRSVGLGVDLVRPLSWVVDGQGMHFDSSRPSDLETILATRAIDARRLARAADLRARIVSKQLTKYNVGSRRWRRPAGRARVILVPGQVPTDAAVSFGAVGPACNMSLLRAVRDANPGAYLVYKVHPDIVAGMRIQRETASDARQWCDELVTDVDMAALLTAVDEVHVMTSLSGFEALLRAKPVTCYGRPFYSGWGLTRDMNPANGRRQRRLTLDELVAGALIEYPVYLSRDGQGLITPEAALDALSDWRSKREVGNDWWRGAYRGALRRLVGVR